MIALIGTMIRERRLQAITLTLLASVAFAAAFGLPAYLGAVDSSSIATELGHASTTEHLVEMVDDVSVKSGEARTNSFGVTVPQQMAASSLSIGYAEQTDVFVLGPGKPTPVPVFEYRQDACDHVVILTGRCPTGGGEVMIDANLERASGVHAGQTVPIAYASIKGTFTGLSIVRVPGFDALGVNVVGVYAPRDADEAFWGELPQFQASSDRGTDAPVLTTEATFHALEKPAFTQYVDAVLRPSAVRPERLDVVGVQVKHAMAVRYNQDSQPDSGIPALLTEITADRAGARQYLPIMALPLIAVGWLVVYLASAYAILGRREELGVVSLRGVRLGDRWRTGIGESILAILAAIPCGYVIALLAIRLAVRFLIPHHVGAPPIGPGSFVYVVVTLAGCLFAVLVSAWRPLRSSTVDLLRGVPSRIARWRTAALEIVVVAAAAAVVYQMRRQSGALSTLDQIAPVLAIGAIAVVAARIVAPVAGLIGRRRVGRGRRGLGIGIGALQVARRPGAARLFTLMTIAVGMATYAAAGASVATAARSDRASLELGGATVVSVGSVSNQRLIHAVRTADPGGRAAMAVAQIPPIQGNPPILAVDSSRLAAVASWPAGRLSAARAAALLSPPVQPAIVATGAVFSAVISARYLDGRTAHPRVTFSATPLDGGPSASVSFTHASPPAQDWLAYVACDTGCRVGSLNITDDDPLGQTLVATIGTLHVTTPAGGSVAGFTTASRWSGVFDSDTAERPDVKHTSAGLTVVMGPSRDGINATLLPNDSPSPVPVLSTHQDPSGAIGAVGPDQAGIPSRLAGMVAGLPGLPDGGYLVDLQNADRAVSNVGVADVADQPQVWLSGTAPPDILTRLRTAGLSIVGVARRPPLIAYLAEQGPAVASSFAVLAVAGALLMTVGAGILTSSVDRRRRGAELRALRAQGLSERSVRSAARFAYVGLGAVAAIAGLVAGLVSWTLTGGKQPLFPDHRVIVGASLRPSMTGLLGWWLVATVVVLIVTGLVARDLWRYVRRASSGGARG
ncbi:MAG TPA: hypothetical protein VGF84_24055 [Micromonosporaceae bacterium]